MDVEEGEVVTVLDGAGAGAALTLRSHLKMATQAMTEQQSLMMGWMLKLQSDAGFGDFDSLDLERYWETKRE